MKNGEVKRLLDEMQDTIDAQDELLNMLIRDLRGWRNTTENKDIRETLEVVLGKFEGYMGDIS